MNVLVFMVPLAMLIGIAALFGFLWSLKNGQYDDVQGTAYRILSDDDLKK